MEPWNRLPREVVESPSLIQDPPGQGPVQPTVGDPASAGGLDWVTHRGPFQPLLFCDSVILNLCWMRFLCFHRTGVLLGRWGKEIKQLKALCFPCVSYKGKGGNRTPSFTAWHLVGCHSSVPVQTSRSLLTKERGNFVTQNIPMYPGELAVQSHLEHGGLLRSVLEITAQTKQSITLG